MLGSLEIASDHEVQVVGIDPACPLILPWDVVAGEVADLDQADTVILDDFALRGESTQVGDTVLLNGRQMRVVAITRHNKSFTTAYAYTNLRAFTDLGGVPGYTHFLAVQPDPGASRAPLAQRLARAAPGTTVYETGKVRSATMMALIARGVGAIFVVVFVGVLVGILIITMTVYTSTMERLKQFAILRAIGAPNSRILGIILAQAVTVTTVSFGCGLALSVGLNALVQEQMGMRAAFPLLVMGSAFAVMVVLAVLGSLISVRKALTVDPMIVFRA
jgi:putative ABC transport system permease protein